MLLITRASNAWTSTPNYRSSYTYDGNGNLKSLVRVDSAGTLMDSLIYHYQTNKNRLTHVDDPGGVASNHSFDVDDQATNNYTYDATGNLTSDAQEGITNIEWTPSNKIRSITKGSTSKLEYTYDAMGNRVVKRYYQPAGTLKHTTWYVRDAQGNVLSVYERESPTSEVKQTEVHLYGSSRLGMLLRNEPYSTTVSTFTDRPLARQAGDVRYELTDHLGNVRAVISDLLVDRPTGFGYATQDAEVIDRRDYYPFGMEMPGRRWRATGEGAGRFGYNGKENDNEVKGEGNQQDYGFRIYDPRIARFLSVDPKAQLMPAWSPYSFCFNKPLVFVDPDGQYPVYILTRAYAPFSTFGPGFKWHGDNRGHTLDRGASYRSLVSINYDTETRQTQVFGGHSRSYTTDGGKDAISPTLVTNRSKQGTNIIDVHSAGTNEAQIGARPIDQFTKLAITTEGNIKKDHVLSIVGTISGDNFPNQESMVYDSKGNGLWLGNFNTTGDREWGPVVNLLFEDENDVNISVNVRVKVNKDGVFQGVMQKEKDGKETMISVGEWNKKFKSDDSK